MKIAQIAPLYESVPPVCYGGTERVISYLTEELVRMGHAVTLYASGDSVTSARLRSVAQKALRLDKLSIDPVADHVLLAERVFQEADQFDFVHSHIDYIGYALLRRLQRPNVTTLHGRLDIPNLYNLYREFSDIPLVSISNYQRLPLSWAAWVETIYHGIPPELYEYREKQGDYLAFVGRISPEKRLDVAIEIAKRADMPLKIAAKVDRVDADYFQNSIVPLLAHPLIEYIGEIGEGRKSAFLGDAYALLFPIDWPEPFGLVMIEAMACGTPVIAHLHGAVPEVIEPGVTGYIVKEMNEAVQAVTAICKLSRKRCREVFEQKFTVRRMAENYLKIYQRLIDRSKASIPNQARESAASRSEFRIEKP